LLEESGSWVVMDTGLHTIDLRNIEEYEIDLNKPLKRRTILWDVVLVEIC
jgi:hypothetical protein